MYKLVFGTMLTLLTYDISVGEHGLLGLIPHFLGFILIYFGVRQFEKESVFFNRLYIPCYVMTVYSAAYYMIKATGLAYNIENFNRFILYFMDLAEGVGTVLIAYFLVFAMSNWEYRKHKNWECKRLQKYWKFLLFCYVLFYISYITSVTSGTIAEQTPTIALANIVGMLVFNVLKVIGSTVYLIVFYATCVKWMEDAENC